MIEWYIPVVLFCAVVPNEPNVCNGATALDRQELNPVNTPINCMLVGNAAAAAHIALFEQDHPNKKLEFRILCKHSSEKT